MKILYEFAEKFNLNYNEVDKFLEEKFNNTKTADDLLLLPTDALKHHTYWNSAPSFVRDFISSNLCVNRYETVTLAMVSEKLNEMLEDGDVDEYYCEFIVRELVDIKFGSVLNDW